MQKVQSAPIGFDATGKRALTALGIRGAQSRRSLAVSENSLKEIIDRRTQVGHPDQRMRTMPDRSQPKVADIGVSALRQLGDEPIGRLHVDLLVVLSIEEQEGSRRPIRVAGR